MKTNGSANQKSTWLKPLLLIALATLITAGCKESAVQGPSGAPPSSGGSSGGGAPPPPSGGMPSPGGGMPPPGGGSPSPPGGSPGDGGSSGPSGESSGGESGEGGSGEVGSVPPPPGQQGGGDLGGGESGGGGDPSGGESGSAGGGGEENPFGDADGGESESECGDTGSMPGGIGGMGRDGECISGGAAASESESESEASSSGGGASGGGSSGGGSSGGGASGGGSSGGGASGGGSSGGESGTGGAGSVGEFPEESAEERAARLGRELDESIGGFDETLGEEQREIAAAGRVVDGFDTEGGGEGSGGTISLGSQTAPTHPDGGMPGSGSGVQTSPIAGMSQQQIEERTPDDVPTKVDDDIIARQLREAALVEEDPDLRDRLWDEYRKYKGLLVAD